MKYFHLAVLTLLSMGIHANCENSNYALVKVNHSAEGVEIYSQLTIGSGTNGNIKGAANGTGSFTFAIYSENSSLLKDFSPRRIAGKNTGCVNSGVLHSAGFNGAQQMLTFSSNDCKFTCVNSTAKCGAMQLEIYTFKFVFDDVPDSIRVFGIEGNGNPFAGCYNSSEMLLNFAEPSLQFKGVRKIDRNSSVELVWQVDRNAMTKEFEIYRKDDKGFTSQIASVVPQFNSNNELIYSYLDNDIIPGHYEYFIKHYDWFENVVKSREVLVNVEASSMLINTDQANAWIEVALKTKKPDKVTLYNFELEEVNPEMRVYKGTLKIRNEGLLPGVYHLKTTFKDDYTLTKLVVL
ncbi:MAG: hypothetical protein AAF487_04795 [Bacteroidota bacterium]